MFIILCTCVKFLVYIFRIPSPPLPSVRWRGQRVVWMRLYHKTRGVSLRGPVMNPPKIPARVRNGELWCPRRLAGNFVSAWHVGQGCDIGMTHENLTEVVDAMVCRGAV